MGYTHKNNNKKKNQEVSVPTEELLLTGNFTQSGMNSNLQLSEYTKILYIQTLQILSDRSDTVDEKLVNSRRLLFWEQLNTWLV